MPNVEFELTIDELPHQLVVRELTIDERLNALPVCRVSAYSESPLPSPRELLRRNCLLEIRRSPDERRFRGIVWHAHTRELTTGGYLLSLRMTTAAHLLTRIVDTYMYQDASVPEIVKDLVERYLRRMQRSIELRHLQRTYPDLEYALQYHESVFDFLNRLCENEGIFFFFDHGTGGADREVLTLADKPTGLPTVGTVPFVRRESHDAEGVTLAEHGEEVGATDVVIDGYDWTNRGMPLRQGITGRGPRDPSLEIYDPHDSIDYYDYGDQHYRLNTGAVQAGVRAELSDLERQFWRLESNVVTAQPGHLLTLTGAPDAELDQEYLITSVTTRASANSEGQGALHNAIECVPSSLPYRPPRITPRPTVHGPETAVVVGGASDEIHTDEHGRVKVQFHWDRQHQRDEQSSCWIRVAQSRAGAGFGTLFIPRVDMEVVVSFLGGNPDRPLVTGCVYNNKNRPHVALPQDKSQSAIRTKSTAPGAAGNSTGYNEILFEDRLGKEYISVHAQRDLLEEVLRNRTTQIHHDDRLTVTNSSYTAVHNEETRTVHHDAHWTYKTAWSRSVNYLETWVGFVEGGEGPGEFYRNASERLTEFTKGRDLVRWSELAYSGGQQTVFEPQTSREIRVKGGLFAVHNGRSISDAFQLQERTWLGLDAINGRVGMRGGNGCSISVAADNHGVGSRIQMTSSRMIVSSPNIVLDRSPSVLEVTADHISLRVGQNVLRLDAAGIHVHAPIFNVNSDAVVTRGGKQNWD